LPSGYPAAMAVRVRLGRWRKAGVLDRIMAAASPAVQRMEAEYLGRIRNASFFGEAGWQSTSQFFGHGVNPRLPGHQRYADRRR
jgi:hypothetical protein